MIKDRGNYYLIRGDNTYTLEKVPASAVIGVLTDFRRKGKEYCVSDKPYRLYARIWTAIYPLRRGYDLFRGLCVKLAKKLGILPFLKRLFKRNP
ncbi:MAG: hypothetical protein IJL30_06150 [Clostridia bacterium]|nr:hypothetical protein [Clostridia bacterium]